MKTDNPTERYIRHVLSNEPRTPQSPDDVRELLGTIDRLRNELAHERETNEKLATNYSRLRAEKRQLVEALTETQKWTCMTYCSTGRDAHRWDCEMATRVLGEVGR